MSRPLFYEDWWLQASAGDALERVVVEWDGREVASLSFLRRKTLGLVQLRLPPYTRTLGPRLALPASKPAARLRNVCHVVAELINRLPPHDRFHLFLDPRDPCGFAFAMAGCTIEEEFTFRLAAGEPLEGVWHGMDPKIRNLIRTAEKKLKVSQVGDCEPFIRMSLDEHGDSRNRHRFDAMRRIFAAAVARGQAITLVADDGAKAAAVAVLVWDAEMLYYWQSTRKAEAGTPGANSLLVWESMKLAKEKGLGFDVDGYHSLQSALFAAKFGLQPAVRPSVSHMSMKGFAAYHATAKMGRKPRI